MRELKFRAWDGECMSDSFGLGDLHDGLVYQEDEAYDVEGKTVMQYTGLKDSKGVEIYEGDIVACLKNRFGKDRHEFWAIEYVDYEASFQVYNQLNSMRRIDLQAECSGSCFSPDGEEEIILEVIGNIYESVHLLESK